MLSGSMPNCCSVCWSATSRASPLPDDVDELSSGACGFFGGRVVAFGFKSVGETGRFDSGDMDFLVGRSALSDQSCEQWARRRVHLAMLSVVRGMAGPLELSTNGKSDCRVGKAR